MSEEALKEEYLSLRAFLVLRQEGFDFNIALWWRI
jgi:hypothetical protein